MHCFTLKYLLKKLMLFENRYDNKNQIIIKGSFILDIFTSLIKP